MPTKGRIIQGWLVRCGDSRCREKLAFDQTLPMMENTLKSLGWRNTVSCGWVCRKHAKERL